MNDDLSVYSESSEVSIFSETNSEIDELIITMEHQIENQNIEIKELRKQIETLKNISLSQLPQYLNAVLECV